MSFEQWYGPDAAGIIHVHHVVPLHEIGEAYEVNPIRDLRPICPNCHAVIHARKPARSIDAVARVVRRGQGQPWHAQANPYEAPSCQETNPLEERSVCFFPLFSPGKGSVRARGLT